MSNLNLPEAALSRLTVYQRALVELNDSGVKTISSRELAEISGSSESKVRKDLSYLGSYGTRGVGYDIERLIREIGVETGGSNVQFAVNPEDGRTVVIEMNPRVSRSSALASKATGFPIAKLAALLAVGYTLDELPNDITKTTVAAFEPSIDYVVAKMPRWAFEKFPGVDPELGPQMKSVGEAMSIGVMEMQDCYLILRKLDHSLTTFGHQKIELFLFAKIKYIVIQYSQWLLAVIILFMISYIIICILQLMIQFLYH